jgi:hypothetical protein
MTHERSFGKMSNIMSAPSRIRVPASALCPNGVLGMGTTIDGTVRQGRSIKVRSVMGKLRE